MSVTGTLRASTRQYGSMIGLGFLGVAGLAVASWWQLSVGARLNPDVVGTLVAQRVIVPAVLVVLAGVVGALVNERLGLRSHVYEWASVGSTDLPTKDTLIAAGGVGISIGLGLFVGNIVMGQTAASDPASLLTLAVVVPGRLLYLGLTEEILLRWGLLSTVAYLGLRWFAITDSDPSRRYVLWGAIVVTALVIPVTRLTMQQGAVPGGIPATLWILAANAVPGAVFGWLFWKRSLEVAMVAHVTTHLPLIVGSFVLL
jgi:hypothetical protein